MLAIAYLSPEEFQFLQKEEWVTDDMSNPWLSVSSAVRLPLYIIPISQRETEAHTAL